MKTTNYFNTFICVADDCPAVMAETPPVKGDAKTVANLQYEMIIDNPYKYTSDDVIFKVYAIRNGIPKSQLTEVREEFFSKGQPCLRSSPLCKRYGWGIHSDNEGKVALYGVDSEEYQQFLADAGLQRVKAMRSKK